MDPRLIGTGVPYRPRRPFPACFVKNALPTPEFYQKNVRGRTQADGKGESGFAPRHVWLTELTVGHVVVTMKFAHKQPHVRVNQYCLLL